MLISPGESVISRTVLLVMLAAVAPTPAFAQSSASSSNRPPTREAMADQMNAVRERVLANMIAQGIDPRDFFDEVRKASPNGSFDLDIVKQKLVEKRA